MRNEKINKKIILQKYYSNKGDDMKIIDELKNYHNKSCKNGVINNITSNMNLVAKNIKSKNKYN